MRSFVAIDLPGHVRATLARQQERLRAACSRNAAIRWTRPEGIHVTLKFLGEVPAEQVAAATSALESLSGFEAFEVEVKGFGFFASRQHPRVLWAGINAPPALGDLAARVERTLDRLGFPPEDRPFSPHLTLARFKEQRPDPGLNTALESQASPSLGSFKVTEFYLFESMLRPGGAEYRRVAAIHGARS